MKHHHEELQEMLESTKTEKEAIKNVVAEKEQVIAATAEQLQDAQASLATVTAEKEMVLDQLTVTAEKCKVAITATEEMKTLLQEDEEQIEQLSSAVSKLESEREELTSRLNSTPTVAQLESAEQELMSRMNSASEEMEAELDPEDDMSLDAAGGRDLFEFGPDDLRGMNMPENLDDSLAYIGDDWMDGSKRTRDRRTSIMALEELEADLKDLLNQSEDVIPASRSRKASMLRASSRKTSMAGGRQMSIFVKNWAIAGGLLVLAGAQSKTVSAELS